MRARPGWLAALSGWRGRRPIDLPEASSEPELVDALLTQARQQRDLALRFLAHDARIADATILGLIDLARARSIAPTDALLLRQIEQEAQAGLERSERFVRLMRAQTRELQCEALDLVVLLQQAVDAAWRRAEARQVRLQCASGLDEAPCLADRGLLTGALADLLAHAIDSAGPGAQLNFSVTAEAKTRAWRMAAAHEDAAHGIALQSPDTRPETAPQLSPDLMLLRDVLRRQGGDLIEIEGAAGAGRRKLALRWPRADTEDRATAIVQKD